MDPVQTDQPLLQDGVYRFRITAGARTIDAVIVLRQGCLDGGTASNIYQGKFDQKGSRLSAKLTVIDWDPMASPDTMVGPTGPPSVITLTGTADAESFHLVGRGRYTAVIEISGRRAAPLTESGG